MKKSILTGAVLVAVAAGLVAPAASASAAPVHALSTATHAPATPPLHAGSRGAAVIRIQHILGIKATGVFDKATVTAVKHFQGAHHLRADGYVGPGTWAALIQAEHAQAVKALAAAKSSALTMLGDCASSAAAAKYDIGVPSLPLTTIDRATLLTRLNRLVVVAAADGAAVRKATTVGQVNALAADRSRLLSAVDTIERQSQDGVLRNPGGATAELVSELDDMVAQAKANGTTLDAAKEATLRAAYLGAFDSLTSAAKPLVNAEFAIDPLSPGSHAKVTALSTQLQHLPQAAATNQAGQAYTSFIYS